MANTITTTSIINGSRVLAVEIQILGDGSGEESDTVVVDYSALATEPGVTELALRKFAANVNGFTAELQWDATTDIPFLTIPDGPSGFDVAQFFGGPVNDRTGAGQTGDVLMTTVGLGAGDTGTIFLEFIKKH